MLKPKFFIISLILMLLIPTPIFAWGSATHAYYAKHLGANSGYLNLQEMYGAMVPDLFNTMFGSPYYDYLWSQSHEEFQKVVNRAKMPGLKAFAFGYASHNDIWGADYTAHHNGCTTPGIGYVEAQIENLALTVEAAIVQILLDNNIEPPQAKEWAKQFAPSIAHGAVETAVDILIKRNEDPSIGADIIAASRFRSSSTPYLLIYTIGQVESSYADEIAATLAYLENKMPAHGMKLQPQPVAINYESECETEIALTPCQFSLSQNFPNPFNSTTTINFSLAQDSHVNITVYNTLGQKVAVLLDGFQSTGSHCVAWDAQNLPGGIYIYKLKAGGFTASKKTFLQK